MIALWGVFAFLFYKVATALTMEQSINLISAFLGGVLIVPTVFFLTGAIVTTRSKLAFEWLRTGQTQPVAFFLYTIVACAGLGFALLMYLLVKGFDQSLADDMLLIGDRYSSTERSSAFMFLVIMAVPVWMSGGLTAYLMSRPQDFPWNNIEKSSRPSAQKQREELKNTTVKKGRSDPPPLGRPSGSVEPPDKT